MRILVIGMIFYLFGFHAFAMEDMEHMGDLGDMGEMKMMDRMDKPTLPKAAANAAPITAGAAQYDLDSEKPQQNFGVVSMHDNEPFFQFMGDRFEWRNDSEGARSLFWDIDAWYGGDYNKLWIESEGSWETDGGHLDEAQVEVYWNHTYATYWDTQLGIRHDFKPGESRSFLGAGVQGLAPYIFETDATAYVSEDGDLSARLELERDFLLTQRLILQPRFETGIALQDVPENNIGSGINDIELGLRLRYEVSRKFAPYVGISWERAVGETADMLKADGEDINKPSLVAGVRIWF